MNVFYRFCFLFFLAACAAAYAMPAQDITAKQKSKPTYLIPMTDWGFNYTLAYSSTPFVVVFGTTAERCDPCQQQQAYIRKVQMDREMSGKFEAYVMDVSKEPETAAPFHFRSLPATALYKDGRLKDYKLEIIQGRDIYVWLHRYADIPLPTPPSERPRHMSLQSSVDDTEKEPGLF